MSQGTSLSEIRDAIHDAQQKTNAGEFSSDASKQLVITPDGEITLVSRANPQQQERLSAVPVGVFAGTPLRVDGVTGARLLAEQEIVRSKLPRGTEPLEVSGIWGWVFNVTTPEHNDRFRLFLFFADGLYQVLVLEPEVEGRYSPHYGHLFSDGRICFGPGVEGYRKLEHTFAKACLWARGFSVFSREGRFPFSVNNLND